MEGVCERMQDYGERTDPSTNRKSYVRVKSRSGEAVDLSEATLDSRVTSSLKFAVSAAFCPKTLKYTFQFSLKNL